MNTPCGPKFITQPIAITPPNDRIHLFENDMRKYLVPKPSFATKTRRGRHAVKQVKVKSSLQSGECKGRRVDADAGGVIELRVYLMGQRRIAMLFETAKMCIIRDVGFHLTPRASFVFVAKTKTHQAPSLA